MAIQELTLCMLSREFTSLVSRDERLYLHSWPSHFTLRSSQQVHVDMLLLRDMLARSLDDVSSTVLEPAAHLLASELVKRGALHTVELPLPAATDRMSSCRQRCGALSVRGVMQCVEEMWFEDDTGSGVVPEHYHLRFDVLFSTEPPLEGKE